MAVAIDTLAYARRLRESGFTEQQAEGQASALAAAMTDTLATKPDLQQLFDRVDVRFAQVDTRFDELEKRMDILFAGQVAHFDAKLADLERRITVRMLGGIAAVSALVKLL